MRKKHVLIKGIKLSIVAFFIATVAFSQNKIDSAIILLNEHHQQENIYIAYNKKKYVVGETIWFKAFVFAGYQLSDISTNLYVELLDSTKKSIAKQRLPVIGGFADGKIVIPDSIAEQVYYFHAYTAWMLNFDERFHYVKPIPVYNPASTLKIKKIQGIGTVTAFSEGGTLVQGLPTKMVVRLRSSGELPSHWRGYLVDSAYPNQKITSFESIDENIASFRFTPQQNVKYQVIVEDGHGFVKECSLPVVRNEGVTISVSQSDSALWYTLRFQNLPSESTYKLVGTIDNRLVYKAQIKNDENVFTHSLKTKLLPSGLLRLTLFDDKYKVVSERLCFIAPDAKKRERIEASKLGYLPKSMNECNIQINTGEYYYAFVMDGNVNNLFADDNLVSSFWLTNDIAMGVKNVSHYFNGEKIDKESLDDLLVTEHWKRFDWNDLISGKSPVVKTVTDNFLSYMVTVTNKNKRFSNEMLNFIVFLPDSTRKFMQAKTNINGEFLMDSLLFEDEAKLSFKAVKKTIVNEDLKLTIAPISYETAFNGNLPESGYTMEKAVELDSIHTDILQSVEVLKNEKYIEKNIKSLQEVIVKAKPKTSTQLMDERLSSGRFWSSRETIFDFVNSDLDVTESGNNLLDWILWKTPGDKDYYTYFINEYPVQEEDLKELSFNAVAMVKIEGKTKFHQILVYLKSGQEYISSIKSLKNISLHGYARIGAPISPDYSIEHDRSLWKTDKRSLLYWSDQMYSDNASQQFKIKFYNNDSLNQIRFIIMGFDETGFPFYDEKIVTSPR